MINYQYIKALDEESDKCRKKMSDLTAKLGQTNDIKEWQKIVNEINISVVELNTITLCKKLYLNSLHGE